MAFIALGAVACSAPGGRGGVEPAGAAEGIRAPATVRPEPTGVAGGRQAGAFEVSRLRADVQWLTDPERQGRGSYQEGGVIAARWVAAQFEDLGLEVMTQRVGKGAVSVFGIQRAGPGAVIVSAHYDHLGVDDAGTIYPGADDNASGLAAMLAIARHAARHRYQHTVIFAAFGAEEPGLHGSGVYVRNPLWPLDDTIGVINFDMVGRNFFEGGANKPRTAAVVGLESDSELATATRSAARRAGLALVEASADLVELFGYDDRTDEWWFRRRGMKALHFSTGMHDDYHRPSDTPDKLVYEQIQRVARTAAGALAHLAERQAQASE